MIHNITYCRLTYYKSVLNRPEYLSESNYITTFTNGQKVCLLEQTLPENLLQERAEHLLSHLAQARIIFNISIKHVNAGFGVTLNIQIYQSQLILSNHSEQKGRSNQNF